MTRDRSFLWATEIRAEPQNMLIFAEYSMFSWNFYISMEFFQISDTISHMINYAISDAFSVHLTIIKIVEVFINYIAVQLLSHRCT